MSNEDKLLNKVLEIVEVMGELRQQLNSFISSCTDKDCETSKMLDDLSKRLTILETEGSAVLREILKNQSDKISEQLEAIKSLSSDLATMKEDMGKMKVEVSKKNWRFGIIVGFITLVATLTVTAVVNHLLHFLI